MPKATPGQERLFAHLATMAKGAPAGDADALADSLTGRFGQRLEIDLARNSGRALPGVLTGETDPLSVLFGDAEAAARASMPIRRSRGC